MTTDATERSQVAQPEPQTSEGTASNRDAEIHAALAAIEQESAPTEETQADEGTDEGEDDTDSAEATEEPEAQDEDDLESYLKEESRAAIAAKAREEALLEQSQHLEATSAEQQKTAAETQRRESQRQAFAARAQGIRQFAAQKGMSQQETDLLVNTFNNHHRDALEVTAWQLTDELIDSLRESLPEEDREGFGYDGSGAHVTDVIKEWDKRKTKAARKGYYSQADVDQKVTDAKAELFLRLKKNPDLLNSRAGPKARSAGAAVTDNGDYPRKSDGTIDTAAALRKVAATPMRS